MQSSIEGQARLDALKRELADIRAEKERRLQAIRGERARRDAGRNLREYMKQSWDLVQPGRRLLWNWHIDCLSEHLEAALAGQIKKLLLNFPPRLAKSLLVCVFFMTW